MRAASSFVECVTPCFYLARASSCVRTLVHCLSRGAFPVCDKLLNVFCLSRRTTRRDVIHLFSMSQPVAGGRDKSKRSSKLTFQAHAPFASMNSAFQSRQYQLPEWNESVTEEEAKVKHPCQLCDLDGRCAQLLGVGCDFVKLSYFEPRMPC